MSADLDAWAERHADAFKTLGLGMAWSTSHQVAEAAKSGEIRAQDVLAIRKPTARAIKDLRRKANSAEAATWYTCVNLACSRWSERHKGATADKCPACGQVAVAYGTVRPTAVIVPPPKMDRVRAVLGDLVADDASGADVLRAAIDAICHGRLLRSETPERLHRMAALVPRLREITAALGSDIDHQDYGHPGSVADLRHHVRDFENIIKSADF